MNTFRKKKNKLNFLFYFYASKIVVQLIIMCTYSSNTILTFKKKVSFEWKLFEKKTMSLTRLEISFLQIEKIYDTVCSSAGDQTTMAFVRNVNPVCKLLFQPGRVRLGQFLIFTYHWCYLIHKFTLLKAATRENAYKTPTY